MEGGENSNANRLPQLGLKRKPGGFNPPAFKKGPGGFVPPSKAQPAAAAAAPAARAAGAVQAGPGPGTRAQAQAEEANYFTVLYTKYAPGKKLRKNKSFADGILEVKASKKATLYDPEGKVVSSSTLCGVALEGLGEGSELLLGGFEMEIDSVMEAEKFRSGQAFLKQDGAAVAALAAAKPMQAFRPVGPSAGFKPVVAGGLRPVGAGAGEPAKAYALHDPHAEGAVVLNREQWAEGNGKDGNGRLVSPVVIDPYIAKHLRAHQVEGVQFMYSCVMGLRENGLGCILADEMGLGKTLQVLALIWTLLKQGPQGRPAAHKVLVVTPSTLTQNWADEARKWLGHERLRALVLQPGADGKQQVMDFKHGNVQPVMVTSYDTLRKHAADLAGCIDLLVCDEGHRLKSVQGNKTIAALTSLNCPRRVLLTGTPMQNNLAEFFAMSSFVCPDVLGSLATFERVFSAPIAKSRDRNASAEEKALGEMRSAELAKRVSNFVLRRTADINAKYLPPLALYVVFCRPSALQLRLYSAVLGSPTVRKMLSTSGADFGDQALTVLTNLKKICNHPWLWGLDGEARGALGLGGEAGLEEEALLDPQHSGKMAALSILLQRCLGAGDRVVVVSQSTAALDLISQHCDAKGYKTARIDGSTDVTKRQDVVTAFNSYNVGQVFLLSTTAGGAGLNLVGANRLVLYDSSWNPAHDLQAMARIWRDGQRKHCVVYRLLTTGTIDEKIYQRQRSKGDIAATMAMGGGGGGGKAGGGKGQGQFSRDELRQLFSLNNNTACDTYDKLQGTPSAPDFCDVSATLEDAPLAEVVVAGLSSFVHFERQQASQQQAQQQEQQHEEGEEEEGGAPEQEGGSASDGASELEIDDAWS